MASLCRRLLSTAPKFSCLSINIAKRSTLLLRNTNVNSAVNIASRNICSTTPLLKKETVTLHFMTHNGEKMTAKASVGDNLLDVVIDNDLDIDGFGACEGTLACSTCHLIFTDEQFGCISDKATDEELDMLDLAYQLEDTSRLGCQVIVKKEMDGWEVRVPAGVADARDV